MNRHIKIFLGGYFISGMVILAAWTFYNLETSTPPRQVVGCKGESFKGFLEFEGEVKGPSLVFHKSVEDQQSLVQLQLLYLYGISNSLKHSVGNNFDFAPDLNRSEIKILQVSERPEKTYRLKFSFPSIERDFYQFHLAPHLRKLLSTEGTAPVKSKEVVIKYSAKVGALFCSNNPEPVSSSFHLILPSDPVFNALNAEFPEVATHLGGKSLSVPVCANPEFALMGKSKLAFWYFWNPNIFEFQGREKCLDLVPRTQVIHSQARISGIKQEGVVAPSQLKWKKAQKWSFLFAPYFMHLDGHHKRGGLEISEVQNFSQKLISVIKGEWVPSQTELIEARDREPALYQMYQTAVALRSEFTGDSVIEVKSTSNLFSLVMTRPSSFRSRELIVEIVYGYSHPFMDSRVRPFARKFVQAISMSNYVFFSGHSGVAENFTVEEVERLANLKISREENSSNLTLVVQSCFAFSKFGAELATKLKGNSKVYSVWSTLVAPELAISLIGKSVPSADPDLGKNRLIDESIL